MGRVASGLTSTPSEFRALRELLLDMRFLPAGRIQAAIGSPKHTTPYNCFVSGTIHDSFVHGDSCGQNSIMDIGKQAAATMRMGGGIGYDFSTLRPSRDLIKGVQSQTDGPMAFMPIYDAVCRATSSAGNRRGAQMGVIRVDHPDILNFIRAKQPSDKLSALWELVESLQGDFPGRAKYVTALQETLKLTGFNLSVAITDEFMECLESGAPFPLRFDGRVYNEVDAHEVWETIMRATWDWAEPGVLYIDRINKMNNLWYCEYIAATNPCGEQPLPPYGACLLGSLNMVRYVSHGSIDMDQIRRDVPVAVRAMDNVVDYARYPLEAQEKEAKLKRRMGLGVTGMANALEATGLVYGTKTYLQKMDEILELIQNESYVASIKLAQEKGSFPVLDRKKYVDSGFMRTMPKELRDDIVKHGIRNSHLTSIAPTGTISYAADNVSSSIEPVIMYEGTRKMRGNSGNDSVEVEVYDYGYKQFGVHGRLANDVTAEEHVGVLITAAKRVDSAVSKTCNVSPDMPWQDFKNIYRMAYHGGAKGCTTFNPGGKRLGIFVAKKQNEVQRDLETVTAGESCTVDFATGRRSCE